MRKTALFFTVFAFFFLISHHCVAAENKAGINIGDHFDEFDRAAEIVGKGGWITIMACPGDTDKIASMIARHPEINLIIRGHHPSSPPNELLAKLWAASLKALPSPNKIYFMPWNEPNQEGSSDYTSPDYLMEYINKLQQEISSIKNKVFLLSPMMNITHPNFDSYIIPLVQNNFFQQFDGIAFSLYDTCNGECSDPHQNPLFASQLLSRLKVSGKKIFGVESGTAGEYFYFKTPPSSVSPLFKYVNSFLKKYPSEIAMIGIPSYDLGGEVGHSWSVYFPPDVINKLREFPDGNTTPGAPPLEVPLKKCPEKKYSFYFNDEGECIECGGTLSSVCKPILKTLDFGEELSKNSLNIPEQAKYDYFDPKCIEVLLKGNITIQNLTIPFVNELNKYFLGPYVDNPKARINKSPEQRNYFTETGVFEKLAPKGLQDQLKLKFIQDTISLGSQSRYYNTTIEGKTLTEIANTFKKIQEKNNQKVPLNEDEKKFLTLIWPQVPLFSNEESQGEIVFYGSGFEKEKNKVKTSVPEVYRLNLVSQTLKNLLTSSRSQSSPISSKDSAVLSETTTETSCPITQTIPPETNYKETKTGQGSEVCTLPKLQEQEKNAEGKRAFLNDAQKSCRDMGDCTIDPLNPVDITNQCCGSHGKCLPWGTGYRCVQCQSSDTCWSGAHYSACCVPDYSEKTKDFTDLNLNSINKVPYLKTIANNLVGPLSLFQTFVPANQTSAQKYFKEVAGESTAQIEIKFDPPQSPPTTSFTIQDFKGTLTLLFHKLGTLTNVQNFISKSQLKPNKAP